MSVSDTRPFLGRSPPDSLRDKSGWIVALGVIYVLAGIAALTSVAFAAVVTVFVVGIMMVVAGVAEVLNALQMKSWGKFVLWMLLGALYVAAGVLTLENPLLTVKFLTLLLGLFLIGSGITRIVLAVSMKAGPPSGVVILSGVLTVAIGAIILIHWPVSSLIVLAVFLGVDLISTGVGWIAAGLGLKRRTD